MLSPSMSIYSSFLIRCWTHRDGAEPKFVVEHVQSGQQLRATRLTEALAWIETLSERSTQEASTHADDDRA